MGQIDLLIERARVNQRKKAKENMSAISQLNYFLFKDLNWEATGSNSEIYKDSDYFLAAIYGSSYYFEALLDSEALSDSGSAGIFSVSPAGNTLLHVAAKEGNEDMVTYLAAKKPSLVLSKNLNGETALHLAAKAGHASTVRALVKAHQENESDENNLLRATNERGNTALLEALFSCQALIAEILIEADPELSYYESKDGESALYLAAKAGYSKCVSLILELSTDQERINEQFKKKSPIQAAIQEKHRGVLRAIFDKNPSFIQSTDSEGRNPLHHAALLGHLKEVHYLLKQYAGNATERDNSGSFPIHLASIEGHVGVISLLLEGCPYPGDLLDSDGRNIVHLSAMYGKSNVVSFLLKHPHLGDLINTKDKNGNVPLHLATMNWHPKIVNALTWDKRVDIKLVNDEGMTALDVAEYYMPNNPPFRQRLTWAALEAAGTPQSRFGKTVGTKKSSDMDSMPQTLSGKTVGTEKSSNMDSTTQPLSDKALGTEKNSYMDRYKERVNTLLVVSTLVATVTFAAGITVPGGYNSSESSKDFGMATMLRQKAFHAFVFCDTIAMYASIVVDVALIWAQQGDFTLMFVALNLAVPLLGIALGMMSMAFTAGMFVAVSNLNWLGTAVLVMGITFIIVLLFLALPLCFSLTSRNRILRYLSHYPFCLMLLIIGSS